MQQGETSLSWSTYFHPSWPFVQSSYHFASDFVYCWTDNNRFVCCGL